MTQTAKIFVTDRDRERLEAILCDVPGGTDTELLEAELERATTVPSEHVHPGIVTLYSRVRYLDEASGKERELTLVCPSEADSALGRVSVLSPVGSALLGLPEGERIDWPVDPKRKRSFKVIEVLFQPELASKRDHDSLDSAEWILDRVDQASLESFPASDPPGWR